MGSDATNDLLEALIIEGRFYSKRSQSLSKRDSVTCNARKTYYDLKGILPTRGLFQLGSTCDTETSNDEEMKSSDGEVRDQREDDRSDKELSLDEVYQIIDEFLEEDRLNRDGRSNSLSKADEFIYAPRSGGWMLPDDLEENEERLSDEHSEFEDLLECLKDKDNKLPVGLSTSTSAKQGKNRRNRKRRSEKRHERARKRDKESKEGRMERERHPDLSDGNDHSRSSGRTIGAMREPNKNGRGVRKDICQDSAGKSRVKCLEDPTIEAYYRENVYTRFKDKKSHEEMDQLCLATSKLFDQHSKKDNEVDKNGRPNNEEWGAIIRKIINQGTNECEIFINIEEDNIVGLTTDVAALVRAYAVFRTCNEPSLKRIQILAKIAVAFPPDQTPSIPKITNELGAVQFLHKVYIVAVNINASQLTKLKSYFTTEDELLACEKAAFLLKPSMKNELRNTLKPFHEFFSSRIPFVSIKEMERDLKRMRSPRAREQLGDVLELRKYIEDLISRLDESSSEDIKASLIQLDRSAIV